MATLTFNANGGSDAPRPITVTVGTVMYFIGMSATPPSDDMVFAGWSTAQTDGNLITELLMSRGMTVYAQYKETQKPQSDPIPTPTTTVAPTTPSTTAPAPTTPSTTAPTQTVAPRPTDAIGVIPVDEAKWAAVNPIISVIGVIIAVIAAVWVLLLSKRNSNNNKQNTSNTGNKGSLQRWVMWLIAAIVLSIVSLLVFFITQDLSLPFGWIADKWAILHVALLAVEFIAIYACLQDKKRVHTKTAKNNFASNNNAI
jgi:heme/copper-type cytochrome/quinol oxidase subunit 4